MTEHTAPRLVPYPGHEPRSRSVGRVRRTCLDIHGEDTALRLLGMGRDTVEIADILWCTEAAAYNALSRARGRR